MTYSIRPSAPRNRTFLRALLVSMLLHAGLLRLIPAIDSGAQTSMSRAAIRAVLGDPDQTRKRAGSHALAPVLVRQERTDAEGVAAKQGGGVNAAKRRPDRRGEPIAARSNAQAELAPQGPAVTSPDNAGLDAAALRGVRIGLAMGLRGVAVPPALVGTRTEARLTYGTGGRLLALDFGGEGSSAALARSLREPLTRVAQAVVLPPQLLAERFEVTLLLEFAD